MSIEALAPLIQAQLRYLLSQSPLSLKVDRVWSGCKSSRYCDRFTLLVPFCLDYVKWDVIYNAFYPLGAPDIIFEPEDEDFHPLSMMTEGGEIQKTKSTLSDWNSRDPTKLFSLIHELRSEMDMDTMPISKQLPFKRIAELRSLYMAYQRKRVGELDDARLKFEISTIFSREGIEMCLLSGLDKAEEVKFVVPLLDMDLNKLVHGSPWRQQQKIYLQVVYPVTRKYSGSPSAPRLKLIATSELKALFSTDDIKLPSWVDGMCMAEYLPTLEEDLRAQLVEVAASNGARRRFIEALAPLFGRPLEADPVFCRRATVLLASGGFTFLAHFILPTQFPKQQPTLVLQSSQHFNSQGTPVMSPPMTDYPWSPRWECSQMVERMYEFLVEECLNFKKQCSETLLP